MIRGILHLVLHAVVPALVAWFWFRAAWRASFFWMMATMVIDLDHLLVVPIYDPNRCGIGLHPLHQWPVIVGYFALTAVSAWFLRSGLSTVESPASRRLLAAHWIGLGLSIHMVLDVTDCLLMGAGW